MEPMNIQSWPLNDCLENYVDECGDNNVTDLEEVFRESPLPEDILVAQVMDVWHFTVKYERERQ